MEFLLLLVGMVVLIAGAIAALFLLRPHQATAFALNAERRRSGLARKEITLPNGLRYVYLEGGTGEPLLLLHGFGADKDNFTRVARFLTPHYRVIAPDHIGFGESDHPQEAPYDPTAQVARLQTLMTALGVSTLHIGGSSMGGHIAMTYAALHPQAVKSLWLLDPSGVWSAPKSELTKHIEATGENLLMARTTDEYAAIFRFTMSKPPFVPRALLNVLAEERIRNFTLEQRIFAEFTADSVEARAATITAPALIVWGELDRAVPAEAGRILQRIIKGSRLILMPGYGHLPMIEAPRQTASDYLAFRAAL